MSKEKATYRQLCAGRGEDAGVVCRTTNSPSSDRKIVENSESEQPVQAKTVGECAGTPGQVLSNKAAAVLQRSGTALPQPVRAFMEHAFGYDFGSVRVHADGAAAETASLANARAFTMSPSIVFARGEYAPDSQAGKWLLAHELTHVVQQQQAFSLPASDSREAVPNLRSAITRRDRAATLRRVKWDTARDTGEEAPFWGFAPGSIYYVETDAGHTIEAWKPHNGTIYDCHGLTFGGLVASGGPFSIGGKSVPTVLADDGWHRVPSCVAQPGNILVFWDLAKQISHSGIVQGVTAHSGTVDETASMLDSKWGALARNTKSWADNAYEYGWYQVFSKSPVLASCGKGHSER